MALLRLRYADCAGSMQLAVVIGIVRRMRRDFTSCHQSGAHRRSKMRRRMQRHAHQCIEQHREQQQLQYQPPDMRSSLQADDVYHFAALRPATSPTAQSTQTPRTAKSMLNPW